MNKRPARFESEPERAWAVMLSEVASSTFQLHLPLQLQQESFASMAKDDQRVNGKR
jgi:hypothetical protein